MQFQFKCCGSNSTADWVNATGTVPNSCCETQGEEFDCTEENAFNSGCRNALLDYLHAKFLTFILVGVGICLIQV